MTAAQKREARAALHEWHDRVNTYESKVNELAWFWSQSEGCTAAARVLRNMALDCGLTSLADLAQHADADAELWADRATRFHNHYMIDGADMESAEELAGHLAMVDAAREIGA